MLFPGTQKFALINEPFSLQGSRRHKRLTAVPALTNESYLKVIAKDGSAGIDKQNIDMFNEDLKGNLFKLWNRMTPGSYFPPPVRTVFIPKKQDGKRPFNLFPKNILLLTACHGANYPTHPSAIS